MLIHGRTGTSLWLRQYAARRTARTPNSPATTKAVRNKANTSHCCQPSFLTSGVSWQKPDREGGRTRKDEGRRRKDEVAAGQHLLHPSSFRLHPYLHALPHGRASVLRTRPRFCPLLRLALTHGLRQRVLDPLFSFRASRLAFFVVTL